MARPHLAALMEDAWNRRKSDTLRERGWGTKIVPHTGYGSVGFVRVLARVLMSRDPMRAVSGDAAGSVQSLRSAEEETRGWRAFVTSPAIDVPVTIRIGEREIDGRTDRSGLVDIVVHGHGLGPGWHQVEIRLAAGPPSHGVGAHHRHPADVRARERHRRHRALDVAAASGHRRVEHLRQGRGHAQPGAGDGDVLPRAS